ncbi:hypothetical protein WICPIJ_003284 [Wickerhamomyces pijperi]|uniref:Uncharacterized protein n=1 Tax=Wickerhamomyces pijperi TaxID=599730 RepID=A0A9P8QA38_WICPI|nr:hypothetical protein WICPIJ_003284 [Wickerhamomyces pijperi]
MVFVVFGDEPEGFLKNLFKSAMELCLDRFNTADSELETLDGAVVNSTEVPVVVKNDPLEVFENEFCMFNCDLDKELAN